MRALRCLELVCDYNKRVLRRSSLSKEAAEAVCEAAGPYFPISFEPPLNDPYGVTPAKLRCALRRALCADARCAAYAVDLATRRCVDEEEDDDLAELEEATALVARGVERMAVSDVAAVAEQVGAALVLGKAAKSCEQATLRALERLASRCAADGCLNAFARGALDNISHDELDTVSGRFATRALRGCARAGGYLAWRCIYERFGPIVASRVVDAGDVSLPATHFDEALRHTKATAALRALVDIVESPDPALFVISEGPLLRHKLVLLRAFRGSDDDAALPREVALLKTKGGAALAERGRVLDDEATIGLLRSAAKRIASEDDLYYLHELCIATSRAAAARPDCAAAVAESIEDAVALAAFAASPDVLRSERFVAVAENQLHRRALPGALAEALRRAREADETVDEFIAQHLVVKLASASSDVVNVFASITNCAGLAERAAAAYVDRSSPQLARIVASGIAHIGDDSLPQLAQALRSHADTDDSALSALVSILVRTEVNVADLSQPFSAAWVAAASAVFARRDKADLADSLSSEFATALAQGRPEARSALDRILDQSPAGASRFWRQRLYTRVAPHLLEPALSHPVVAATLVALARRALPRPALKARADQLLDVALARADGSNSLILLLLDTEETRQHITTNLHTAIPNLLADATEHPSPRERVDALRCLRKLAVTMPHDALYPFRQSAPSILKRALDDNLRVVRHHAAIVRNEWLGKLGRPAV